MLDYLLLALVGCFLGVITGITPGVHVNTVCLLGLTLYASLGLDPLQFSVAMVAMAVTHTFLDFIPAIFVGVPEEETALSVLPAHQLLLQGKSLDAVKMTAYGSLLGLAFALLFLIPALYIVPTIYRGIRGFVVYLIIIAMVLLILREKRRFWAVTIFLISGFFGLITLNLKIISPTQVLFPVFAGMFGLSTMLNSLKSKTVVVPQEEFSTVKVDKQFIGSGLLGSIGGILVGVLPGMSPSQIGILMYEVFGQNARGFLVSVSAINTSDAIYSLVSLYTIHNPRSGVATMIGQIIEVNWQTLAIFIGVIAFVGLFATLLQLQAGKLAVRLVGRINYRLLNWGALFIVLVLIYSMTGFFGILIATLATCIGLLPILSGVSRTHVMGVLILPTILYFLEIG